MKSVIYGYTMTAILIMQELHGLHTSLDTLQTQMLFE